MSGFDRPPHDDAHAARVPARAFDSRGVDLATPTGNESLGLETSAARPASNPAGGVRRTHRLLYDPRTRTVRGRHLALREGSSRSDACAIEADYHRHMRDLSNPTVPFDAIQELMSKETQQRREIAAPAPSLNDSEGSPADVRAALADVVAKLSSELVELSRTVHDHPEVGYEEHHACSAVAELLRAHGLEPEVGVYGMDTALRVEFVGQAPARAAAEERATAEETEEPGEEEVLTDSANPLASPETLSARNRLSVGPSPRLGEQLAAERPDAADAAPAGQDEVAGGQGDTLADDALGDLAEQAEFAPPAPDPRPWQSDEQGVGLPATLVADDSELSDEANDLPDHESRTDLPATLVADVSELSGETEDYTSQGEEGGYFAPEADAVPQAGSGSFETPGDAEFPGNAEFTGDAQLADVSQLPPVIEPEGPNVPERPDLATPSHAAYAVRSPGSISALVPQPAAFDDAPVGPITAELAAVGGPAAGEGAEGTSGQDAAGLAEQEDGAPASGIEPAGYEPAATPDAAQGSFIQAGDHAAFADYARASGYSRPLGEPGYPEVEYSLAGAPADDAEQAPADEHPADALPTGEHPADQFAANQFPAGQTVGGDVPADQFAAGQTLADGIPAVDAAAPRAEVAPHTEADPDLEFAPSGEEPLAQPASSASSAPSAPAAPSASSVSPSGSAPTAASAEAAAATLSPSAGSPSTASSISAPSAHSAPSTQLTSSATPALPAPSAHVASSATPEADVPEPPADAPCIAILAEYDALPGIGHGCGHNVMCANSVGAFLALVELERARPGSIPGRIVLQTTPAEECSTAKEILSQQGMLEGVDAAIQTHSYSYDATFQTWLGVRRMTVTYTGRPAHASSQPYMGRNALDAATLALTGLGLLRQQILPMDRLHGVITHGGDVPNIIPERVELSLLVRSKYLQTLRDLVARVEDVLKGAALMTGTGVEIKTAEHTNEMPVRNNGPLMEAWVRSQRERGREPLGEGVIPETIAAGTDFGNVSQRVPGIHPLVKIADESVALHTREMADAAGSPAGDQGAIDGAYGLAAVALDYLHDAKLRKRVREDFEASGGAVDVAGFWGEERTRTPKRAGRHAM